jgi:hypothetical protein
MIDASLRYDEFTVHPGEDTAFHQVDTQGTTSGSAAMTRPESTIDTPTRHLT